MIKNFLRLKLVFWLCWLRTFIKVVAFLIIFPTHYLNHILWKLVLSAIRIIVVEDNIYQVYTNNWDTGCSTTRPLVIIIALGFTKIFIKKLDFWQNNRLLVRWFGLGFFCKKFEGFFFLIPLLTLSTISHLFLRY